MSSAFEPAPDASAACGACGGSGAATPVRIHNRPGLPALAFRAGTHARFRASLLAGLSTGQALGALRTRDPSDPTLALFDAFAGMADVLTFYSERIANESYLRTATELQSVLELACTVGYERKPGVAASTWLAFTVEEAPGAPARTEVPPGTQVQSVPGPGEVPQTFETNESLDARSAWNVLRARSRAFVTPYLGQTELCLRGTATNLQRGDALLVVGREREGFHGSENWDFRRVQALELFPDADPSRAYTRVTLDRELGSSLPEVHPARSEPKVYALRTRANLFAHNAAEKDEDHVIQHPTLASVGIWGAEVHGLRGEYFRGVEFNAKVLTRVDPRVNFEWGGGAPAEGLPLDLLSIRWTGWLQAPLTGEYTFIVDGDDGFRLRIDGELVLEDWKGRIAGYPIEGTKRLEAGRFYSFALEFFEQGGAAVVKLSWRRPGHARTEIIPAAVLWPERVASPRPVYLESVLPGIVAGSWAVLSTPQYQELYEVSEAVEDSRTGFGLSAKTTRLLLQGENLQEKFDAHLRSVSVFAQSDALAWAGEPILQPVWGASIELDRRVDDLPAERRLIVEGCRARVRAEDGGYAFVSVNERKETRREVRRGEEFLVQELPRKEGELDRGGPWKLIDHQGLVGVVSPGAAKGGDLVWLPSRPDDETCVEFVILKRTRPSEDGERTILELGESLANVYDRSSLRVLGNVASATHGETVEEVLGHGDAGATSQRFALKQEPLTHTAASTESGVESSLEVFVDGVRWSESPTLLGRGRRERTYVARRGRDGRFQVQFGDGESGAVLPTGFENVRARYRKGIGRAGAVKGEQLSLLLARPLGIRSVRNPAAATGADEPERIDDAKRNAPLQTLTLGRIVSLRDYQDFARAFAGVARARATWVWTPRGRGVLLDVLGPQGASLPSDKEPVTSLRKALDAFRDARTPLAIASGALVPLTIVGEILARPEHTPSSVKAVVDAALLARLGFEARDFGQGLALSELYAWIVDTPGVESVRKLEFRRAAAGAREEREERMRPAQTPPGTRLEDALTAEILVLEPAGLVGLEVKDERAWKEEPR